MLRLNKHNLIAALCLGLFVLWGGNYYFINNGKCVQDMHPVIEYLPRQMVEYSENITFGKDDRSIGYAISVENSHLYNCDEYLELINKDMADFSIEMPEKIMVIEIKITNLSNYDGNDGVDFYPIWLIGDNWYQTFSREFTSYSNEIFEDNPANAFGIQVPQGHDYNVKIVYALYKHMFSEDNWDSLEYESSWLVITRRPVRQIIKIC